MKHFTQFFKFAAVGASGVIVNSSVLFILVSLFGLPLVPAGAIATEISIFTNFMLNDRITFVSPKEGAWLRFVKFNVICLGGSAIHVSILWALAEYWGIYYLVANLGGVGIAFLWNYFINKKVTWGED